MESVVSVTVDAVLPRLSVRDKADLLRQLAATAAAHVGLPERDILEALRARERLGSTALSKGVALPHARLDGVPPFILMARLDRGIDYEARDDAPVDLVFLVLWPAEAAEGFLPTLSALCRGLRDTQVPRQLRRAETADAAEAILRDAGAAQPPATARATA